MDILHSDETGHWRYSMGSDNGANGKMMRIGDLAKRAGTTMRTIRYYEERGLIDPARRTRGGFRLYQEEELHKLHLIRSLQVLDMPLAQVKAFFDERQRGRTAAEIAPGLQSVLREQLKVMERRIAQYRAMQDSARETIEILDACARCPQEPGPGVCRKCPVIASRATLPLHMETVIEASRETANATSETPTVQGEPRSVSRVPSTPSGTF